MKRKRTKRLRKADAILTADIELRAFTPTCRTDDHWKAQERKIAWLRDLAAEHDCPILDAGDLFDKRYKSNPSHELLVWTMENLPQPFYTVPGNHDLPGKSIENYSNSAMAVLEKAGVIEGLPSDSFLIHHGIGVYGFPWGVKIEQPTFFENLNVALVHAMVYEKNEPFPDCDGYSAKEMMALLPDFDLIVCGHNHQTFTRKYKGRLLVNPGSLMRNDADQIDHRPSVFLWYAKTNTVEQVFIPIEQGVIDRDYIDVKKAKENRLDAFVEKLGEQVSLGINFQDNLERNIVHANVSKTVEDKIWKYYEGI